MAFGGSQSMSKRITLISNAYISHKNSTFSDYLEQTVLSSRNIRKSPENKSICKMLISCLKEKDWAVLNMYCGNRSTVGCVIIDVENCNLSSFQIVQRLEYAVWSAGSRSDSPLSDWPLLSSSRCEWLSCFCLRQWISNTFISLRRFLSSP
jgi:hypothetical protein